MYNDLELMKNHPVIDYSENIDKINEELDKCIKKPYYTYYENIDIK